jgi:hypothetical protein
MSTLLKTISLSISTYNLDNYKKVLINVITICLLFALFSCEVSEKAEKARSDVAYKTVSVIPPTQEESEFFQISYERTQGPKYPWEIADDRN